MLMGDLTHYSMEDLRDMYAEINHELDKRKNLLREERFNTMLKAIQAFREVCPCATVFDYENSVPIVDVANRNNWDFGE